MRHLQNPFAPVVGHYPPPTLAQLAKAHALTATRTQLAGRQQDSHDSCGADGFLSRWADGLDAQEKGYAAEILRHGGCYTFLGLFVRLSDGTPGARVRASIVDGEYGGCWALCDHEDEFTGEFLSAGKTLPDWDTGKPARALKRTKVYRYGLIEAFEWAPAEARTTGTGYGLSGKTWVAVFRQDDGYPPDAVPYADRHTAPIPSPAAPGQLSLFAL